MYSSKLIYLLLLQKLDNFVGFITPVVERWLILISVVAALAPFEVSFLWLVAWLLRSRWCGNHYHSWLAMAIWQYFHNQIYVSETKFVKLVNDFNLSIYHLAVYLQLLWRKKVFPIEHIKFMGPQTPLNLGELLSVRFWS